MIYIYLLGAMVFQPGTGIVQIKRVSSIAGVTTPLDFNQNFIQLVGNLVVIIIAPGVI